MTKISRFSGSLDTNHSVLIRQVTDGLDAASRKLFRPMGLALDITRRPRQAPNPRDQGARWWFPELTWRPPGALLEFFFFWELGWRIHLDTVSVADSEEQKRAFQHLVFFIVKGPCEFFSGI